MIDYKPEKLWGKDYLLIIIACGCISFCNHFFFSTLPIYAQNLTGTAAYSGLMTGIYTLAALAVRPFSGNLSDKYGRVKLLVLGAFLCFLACALYNFATILILLLFIRTLHGVGFGIHSTSSGAAAADIIPKPRLAEGLGYVGLCSTFAAGVAPGIALSIIGNGETQEFKTLFILSAVISFTAIILSYLISYEREIKRPGQIKSTNTNTDRPKTFLGYEQAVLLPAAVMMLLYISMSSVLTFLPLFALERHLGNIGFFFILHAAGIFSSRLFLGKVVDKRGPDVVVVPAVITLASCFVLIAFVHRLFFLLLLAFPIGLAHGAFVPAFNSLIFHRCSPHKKGAASAAFSSSIDIGYGIGSILFGFVIAWSNYYFVYFGSMIFAVTALIIYILYIAKRKTPGDIQPAGENGNRVWITDL